MWTLARFAGDAKAASGMGADYAAKEVKKREGGEIADDAFGDWSRTRASCRPSCGCGPMSHPALVIRPPPSVAI